MTNTKPWLQYCTWAALALVLRAAAMGLAKCTGFVAISDDDYARVAIAQSFAFEPRWDASGSSWLPLPFWLTGGVMRLSTTAWHTAEVLAWVTSCCSVLLFMWCAHAVGLRRFCWGSSGCLFAVLPHAVWLGTAVVPEGYAAVLALAGVCTYYAPLPHRVFGVLCLLLATLSRYEAWPVAFTVAAAYAWRAIRQSEPPQTSKPPQTSEPTQATEPAKTAIDGPEVARGGRLVNVALAGLCVAGPLGWMVHGLLTHGDGLFFVKRVVDYRAALGVSPKTWLAVLSNYPAALATCEPVLTVLALVSGALAYARLRTRRAPIVQDRVVHHRPLLLGAAALGLVFLIWGDVSDGAPTHHPERALLTIWLLVLLISLRSLQTATLRTDDQRLSAVWFGCGLTLCAAAGSGLWWSLPSKHFTDRSAEVALGERLAGELDPSRRLFVETEGYEYLAVSVGTGRPWLVDGYNRHDPRQSTSGPPWSDGAALDAYFRQRNVRWLVVPEFRAKALGGLATEHGAFGSSKIFRTTSSLSTENSEQRAD